MPIYLCIIAKFAINAIELQRNDKLANLKQNILKNCQFLIKNLQFQFQLKKLIRKSFKIILP